MPPVETDLSEVFEGFIESDIATAGTTIHGRRGGPGPLVPLLHGISETHLMWYRVAPLLSGHFTAVATDLRGFGDSGDAAVRARPRLLQHARDRPRKGRGHE